MRLISGVVAAAILAALAQPALAVCVIRGGVTNCYADPKYWKAITLPGTETPGAPGTSLKAIVLRPNGLSGNAWVMRPQPRDNAGGNAAACTLGVNC